MTSSGHLLVSGIHFLLPLQWKVKVSYWRAMKSETIEKTPRSLGRQRSL